MSLTPNGEGEGLSLTGLPAVSALSSEVGERGVNWEVGRESKMDHSCIYKIEKRN